MSLVDQVDHKVVSEDGEDGQAKQEDWAHSQPEDPADQAVELRTEFETFRLLVGWAQVGRLLEH